MKGGKLKINRGAKKPKASWGKSVATIPKGNSAPGPHWGHTSMISKKARIKGQ